MSIQIGRRGSAEVLSSSDVQGIISGQSGWQVFVDNLHTVGSPQVINAGVTSLVTNNSSLIIADQLPLDATQALWNSATNKFIPIHLNDFYTWIVRFKAKNSSATGAYFELGIDIGAPFNTIFTESHPFIKGANTEQSFNIAMFGYSGAEFLVNGGLPKITSVVGNTSIYTKEFHVLRHHKGRP
jgi:hypothetical protein